MCPKTFFFPQQKKKSMKSKFFHCFRPIVEDQSTSCIITKRSEQNDQLFESKSSRGNRRDKFFKGLNGQSSKKNEITSIGTLCKGNKSSKKYSYNHRESSSASTSCHDENKKSSTSVHLIIFTLFVTIYFGRVFAIFLTLLWIILFSIIPKSISDVDVTK
ncbi:hypothetical protein AABB24_020569 [Solanum stoloniferum]|uniref:Uncharacterized protein n=1 Tax=Solanum stoloniferum TaxID=62892 RepID=A0ABD2T8R5_9SOLN